MNILEPEQLETLESKQYRQEDGMHRLGSIEAASGDTVFTIHKFRGTSIDGIEDEEEPNVSCHKPKHYHLSMKRSAYMQTLQTQYNLWVPDIHIPSSLTKARRSTLLWRSRRHTSVMS